MSAGPHRLADIAAQVCARVWSEEPEALGRWLYGELDALDRLRLLFMLAARCPIDDDPKAWLAWFLADRARRATGDRIFEDVI